MNEEKLFREIDYLGSTDEYLAFTEEHFGLKPGEIMEALGAEELEKREPVTWEEVLATDGMDGIWEKDLAKKKRPQDYPKGWFVLVDHFRGKGSHKDFRVKMNDHLEGFTITDLIEGAIDETIDSLAKANKYRWNNQDTFKFQPDMGDRNVKAVAVKKAQQPIVWMNVRNVVFPKGSVGATRFLPGVFRVVDQGMAYIGVQKPYFKEWFLNGKHFKGRLVFRLIAVRPEWVKKPKGKLQWQCLTSKTQITVDYGTKTIDQIRINDRVLTHSGEFHPVKKIYTRDYNGEIFKLKIHGIRIPIEITSEHPVLTLNRLFWDVDPKRGIFRPKESTTQIKQTIWKFAKDLTIDDFVISPKIKKNGNKNLVFHASGKSRWEKFTLKLSPELLRLIGYYLGDGTIWESFGRGAASRGLRFSLNAKKDTLFRNDLIAISKKLFGKEPYVKIENSGNGKRNLCTVIILSTPLADDFRKYFGEHSRGKHIHPVIFNLESELQKELIIGYLRADGCTVTSRPTISAITTVSKVLRDQLILLCISAGLKPFWMRSVYHDQVSYKVAFTLQDSKHSCTHQDGKFVFRRIDKIEKEKYSGKLYNLHIENDNSYCANFIAVHNCWMTESTSKGQLPYLLSPRGRSRKDVAPPAGESWLPPEWETKIKTEFRWWPDSKSKQQKIKLMDEAYNDLIEKGEIKARKLKLAQELQTDTAVVLMTYGELKAKGWKDEQIIEQIAKNLLPIGFTLDYWKKKVKEILRSHGILQRGGVIRKLPPFPDDFYIPKKLYDELTAGKGSKRGFEDFEYLLHHIHIGEKGKEEIHHCLLYDHIANMFEQAHLLVKNGKVYINGKLIKEGIFHIIKGLEPTQKVIWSDIEARENKIKPKMMRAGMALKEKAKEW